MTPHRTRENPVTRGATAYRRPAGSAGETAAIFRQALLVVVLVTVAAVAAPLHAAGPTAAMLPMSAEGSASPSQDRASDSHRA